MKTLPLLTTILVLPAASLLAQGQSELDILRARVDVQERRISQLESSLNRLSGSSARTSSSVRKKSTPPKAVPVATSTHEYVVAKGDILTRIAHRHQTTVEAIKKENNLKSDGLQVGQKLQIPVAKGVDSQKLASQPKVASLTPAKTPVSLPTPGKYTVKSGDTFYGIGRRFKMSEASLQAANPKAQPTRLQIGQVLVIDASAKPSAPVAKKAPSKTAMAKSTPEPKQNATNSPPKKSTSIRTITVHQQMTYGAFASQHGASTNQLNSLNGLNLSKSTMLAKGSELYVPQY